MKYWNTWGSQTFAAKQSRKMAEKDLEFMRKYLPSNKDVYREFLLDNGSDISWALENMVRMAKRNPYAEKEDIQFWIDKQTTFQELMKGLRNEN